ncbi:hypothetical protein ACFW9F_13940 [Streptomyces sp. NPDC059506]|uniref:Uncharacterized protein n=1 Tax=Streptomyces thermolineatus TaxID=44033 RepID=A0ABN3MMS0_9ACTN|nr:MULTISPECIES: hypothetical protein [unclassified Streptomyces]MCZ2526484.1 hypothetical protein [Streptomyces sp. HB2AG]PLW74396.1 hypothetical protein C0036_02115 [Streptomyces sp. DJ]QMV23839.1 hypothetical protein GQS52_21000 [Streptomyces sp. SCUT-3]
MTVRFAKSGSKKDMTLSELEQFVQAARKAGAPGDQPVKAVVSTSGKIKTVEIQLPEPAAT